MRANLPIAILSLIGVAAAAAAGCSATLTVGGLGGVTPVGAGFAGPGGTIIDWGTSCVGEVYYADGSGAWAYCDSGVWGYTLTDPSTISGYTVYGGGGGGGDGGGPGGGDGAGGGGDGAGGGDGGGGGGDGAGGGGDGGGGGGDGGGGGGGG